MMTHWLLITWLCAGPGPTGECVPQPTESYPTRATCLAATLPAAPTQEATNDRR